MWFFGRPTVPVVRWGTYTLGDGTVLQFLRYRSGLVSPKTTNCYVYLQDVRDSLSDVMHALEMLSSCTGHEVWTYFYRGTGGSGGRFDIYGETTMLDTLDWLEHMLLSYASRCMDLFLVSDRWSTVLTDVLFTHPALLNALTLQRYVVPVCLRVLPAYPVHLPRTAEYFSFLGHVELVCSTAHTEITTQEQWLLAMRQDFPHLFVQPPSFPVQEATHPCFMQISANTMRLFDENVLRHFPSTQRHPECPQVVHIIDECQDTYEEHTRCRLIAFLADVATEPVPTNILLHVDVCGTTETIYYTTWKKRHSICQKYSLDTATSVRTNGILDRFIYTVIPRIIDTRLLVPWYVQSMPQQCVITIPRGAVPTPRKIHGHPRLLLQLGDGPHTPHITCTVFLCSDLHHLPQVLLSPTTLHTTQDLLLPYCNYTLFPSSRFVLLFKHDDPTGGFLSRLVRRSITVTRAEMEVPLLLCGEHEPS